MRSQPESRRLSLEDAIHIFRARGSGVACHVIAARLAVNPGRISEILHGRRFPEAKALAFSTPVPLNDDIAQSELPLLSTAFGCKLGVGGSRDV